MEDKPFIEFKQIKKNYGHIEALKGINLDVYRGEVIGLVGDNAAGKSTFINILSGAIPQTSGKIFFEGEEIKISSPADARKLGIETVYQTLELVEQLPIYINIFLGRLIYKKILGFIPYLDVRTMIKKSSELIKLTGIRFDSITRKVIELSGGQRQVVAIARAIFFKPKLLILDEPTSGIAAKGVENMEDIILNLKKEGITIIYISHRLESILKTADRIVVLSTGVKVMDEKKENLTYKDIVHKMFGLN